MIIVAEVKIENEKIIVDNTILEKKVALGYLEDFKKMKEHLKKNPEASGVKKIVVGGKMFDFNVGGKIGVASVFADDILTRDELDALEMNEKLIAS